ncbi:ATP-binding protein [Nocardiopsis lambiniae]|uniref:ATP-binding protein n=1 Tax=Nocardiopsis lambiniae TaxID=3075539 RepID=A0ABU2M8H9_9ACTN|nr:ATP-binding protein [Nocardiopsis sp. DSM 44743]MDT0328973.1 ATP-binding protein [Nocardiopsis sp. DSM 44743]
MNAELVSSEQGSGTSWSRPSLAEAPRVPGGRWTDPLGGVPIGRTERASDTVTRSFGSVPDSVSEARRFADRVLAEWGVTEVGDDVRLIVSELVGNACRHALSPGRGPEATPVVVRLGRTDDPREVACLVADSSDRLPRKVDAHHFAESGRGLSLVAAFSREWGWNALSGGGKIVWAVCGGRD